MYLEDRIPNVVPVMIFTLPIIAVMGGILFSIVKTIMRARVRELEIRERIAMIERGLVPPPEVDPRGFDRAMARHDYAVAMRPSAGIRHRRAGVTMMGVGFGLLVLLTSTADFSVGVGVGGFIIILGLAFFINSLLDGGPDRQPFGRYPAPPGPPTPPLTTPTPPPPGGPDPRVNG